MLAEVFRFEQLLSLPLNLGSDARKNFSIYNTAINRSVNINFFLQSISSPFNCLSFFPQ
jgi:hypothetical protein